MEEKKQQGQQKKALAASISGIFSKSKERLNDSVSEDGQKTKILVSDSGAKMTGTVSEAGESNKKTVEICDKAIKWSVYGLSFLLPIFFLPWTSNFLDFNKQALLIAGVFAGTMGWVLKSLISGRGFFSLSRFNIAVVGALAAFSLSTIFSISRYGSFWGWPLHSSENLMNLIGLVFLFFLIVNNFSKKEAIRAVSLVAISCGLVFLSAILQLFGIFVFPFSFAKNQGFNTVGSFSGLGFLAAAIFPLMVMFFFYSKKYAKTIMFLSLAAVVVFLALANLKMSWWMVGIISALLVTFGIVKKNLFQNSNWVFLPMVFLAIALFFGVFQFRFPGVPQMPLEVFVSQKASWQIMVETFKEKEKAFFGSGLGTFQYQIAKFKPVEINNSIFWNSKFGNSASKIFDVAVAAGIIGLIAFLALLVTMLFKGWKRVSGIISDKADYDAEFAGVELGIFASICVIVLGFFLFPGNLTMDFLFFLLMGAGLVLAGSKKKEVIFEGASARTLGMAFSLVLLFVLGIGVFVLGAQRYWADIKYVQGIKLWGEGKVAESRLQIEKAANLNPKSDLYLRDLSKVALVEVNVTAADSEMSQEKKNEAIKSLIKYSIDVAQNATKADPANVLNYSTLGYIYQNLIGVVSGTEDFASGAYAKASSMEPANPFYLTQKGMVDLRIAVSLPANSPERAEAMAKTEQVFQKAIRLKPDYAPARYQMSLMYQTQNRTEEAIQKLEETKQIAFDDIGVAFQLGVLYYNQKEFQKAKAEFERAVMADAKYANALYFLGLTYYELRDVQNALLYMEKVEALNPDNEIVKKVIANLETGNSPLAGIGENAPIQDSQEGEN